MEQNTREHSQNRATAGPPIIPLETRDPARLHGRKEEVWLDFWLTLTRAPDQLTFTVRTMAPPTSSSYWGTPLPVVESTLAVAPPNVNLCIFAASVWRYNLCCRIAVQWHLTKLMKELRSFSGEGFREASVECVATKTFCVQIRFKLEFYSSFSISIYVYMSVYMCVISIGVAL